MHEPPAKHAPPDTAAPPAVALSAVRKVYRMGEVEIVALDELTLRIAAGEFVAIMGSSGSGKSTLMNIVGCLDRPTSGRYHLLGEDVSDLSRAARAEMRNRMLGFVFQSFHLLPRTTALENVELPLVYAGCSARERRRRATAALERVGLGERLKHHPSQLSGGQQQRAAIARALVNAPRILLADEPTGNLDSRTRAEVMALFAELSRSGITLVVVTHEPEVAAYASRVVALRDGRVASDGPAAPPAAPEASR